MFRYIFVSLFSILLCVGTAQAKSAAEYAATYSNIQAKVWSPPEPVPTIPEEEATNAAAETDSSGQDEAAAGQNNSVQSAIADLNSNTNSTQPEDQPPTSVREDDNGEAALQPNSGEQQAANATASEAQKRPVFEPGFWEFTRSGK